MITVTLPFPPAVNNLFANGKRGRFPTARYEAWRTEADLILRGGKWVDGPFEAHMVFQRPDRRGRDIDNLAKAPLDALCRMGVIEDDSLTQRLVLEWAGDETFGKRATVTVTVRRWEEAMRGKAQ